MAYEQKYDLVPSSTPPPYQIPTNYPGHSPNPINQPGYTHGAPLQMQVHQSTVMQPGSQEIKQEERLLIGSLEGHREWSSGLCNVFGDIKTQSETEKCYRHSSDDIKFITLKNPKISKQVIFVWFCPSCALSDVSSKIGESCWLTCCLPGIAALPIRTRLRTLGGIRGSICQDAMTISCCYWCSLIQMSREVDAMGLGKK